MIFAIFTMSSKADVKFENNTKSLVGIRMQNNATRVDSHALLHPGEIHTYKNAVDGLVISTQIITGSYVINCCEWLAVQDNKKVIISDTGVKSENCRCVIK
jgi:hypothetical protein